MSKESAPAAAAAAPAVAEEPAESLAGTRWTFTNIGGKLFSVSTDRNELNFSPDGRVAGVAGCNRLAGSYAVAGDKVTIGPLAMTQMACPDMAAEQEVARVLAGPVTYWINGEVLVLTAADNSRLVLKRF